jgi:hypothetical protein
MLRCVLDEPIPLAKDLKPLQVCDQVHDIACANAHEATFAGGQDG